MKQWVLVFLSGLLAVALVGCPPKPGNPAISVSLSTLDFGTEQTELTFEVWNGGDEDTTLSFSLSWEAAWIASVTPANGTSTGSGDRTEVRVTIDRTGLAQGQQQTATLTVAGTDVDPVDVTVTMDVPASTKGTIVGWVTDTNGVKLPNVTVTLDGEDDVKTDSLGLYSFEEVDPGVKRTLMYERDGYTANSRTLDVIEGETSTANVTLKQREEAKIVNNVEAGGDVEDDEGNRIKIPPTALVDENDQAVTGDVDIQITSLGAGNEAEAEALPGDLLALNATKSGTVRLEAFALVDFYVTQGGRKVQLAAGKTADIELPLPAATSLYAGLQVALWSYDEDDGVWVNSGTGTVASDGVGGLLFTATVDHLSWWACAVTVSESHCLTGRVLDLDGSVVGGAQVAAIGLDYTGLVRTTSASDGTFCLDVKRGSQVRVVVVLPGGQSVAVSEVVSVPDTEASCEGGGCTALGDFTGSYMSCVQGVLLASSGNPIAGAEVRSSAGTSAVTDDDGWFCMEAPGNTQIYLYTLDRPAVPVTTNALGTCESGICVEVTLDVTYPEAGDLVGEIRSLAVSGDALGYSAEGEGEGEVFLVTGQALFTSSGAGVINAVGDVTGDWNIPVWADRLDPDTCAAMGTGELLDLLGLDWTEDELLSLSALDPGTPGAMIAAGQTISMVRLWDVYQEELAAVETVTKEEPGESVVPPILYGWFVPDEAATGLAYSNAPIASAAFTWPGGEDIGAFDVSMTIPLDVTVTSPTVYPDAETTGMGEIDKLNLEEPLTVTWETVEEAGAFVQIIVWSEFWTSEMAEEDPQEFCVVCNAVDDGSFTISAEYLSQLDDEPVDVAYSYYYQQALWVNRVYLDTACVPLVKSNTSGYVDLVSNTFPVLGYYTSYQYVKAE